MHSFQISFTALPYFVLFPCHTMRMVCWGDTVATHTVVQCSNQNKGDSILYRTYILVNVNTCTLYPNCMQCKQTVSSSSWRWILRMIPPNMMLKNANESGVVIAPSSEGIFILLESYLWMYGERVSRVAVDKYKIQERHKDLFHHNSDDILHGVFHINIIRDVAIIWILCRSFKRMMSVCYSIIVWCWAFQLQIYSLHFIY